jgi:HK97 family phage prohead protease
MIVHKEHRSAGAGLGFVLSDESVDRMGDVIRSAGWRLDSFKRNPIALFGHQSSFPIGTWKSLHIDSTKKALVGELEFAPAGTSARIDELRGLVKAGILRAVSVGFRELQSQPRRDNEGHVVGLEFTSQELVEASLVSVPANSNALAVSKALGISPATRDMVFSGTGQAQRFLSPHAAALQFAAEAVEQWDRVMRENDEWLARRRRMSRW